MRGRSVMVLAAAVVLLLTSAALVLVRLDDRPADSAAIIGLAGAQSRPTSLVGAGGLRRGPGGAHPYVPRNLLVRFAPGASPVQRAAARARVRGTRLRTLSLLNAELIRLPKGISVRRARAKIAPSRAVLYSEPNFIYRTALRPNDPLFGQLWGEENSGQAIAGTAGSADADIDAPEAWDVTTGNDEVVVGVVDSGVAYDHPDLAPNIWTNAGEVGGGRESNGRDDDGNGYVDDVRGWDWVGDDNQPRDLDGHGTHVAGTIAARGNDGFGVSGVAWTARLMPLRALDASGSGTSADIAAAFAYAGRHADVVNASLGGPSFSQAVLDAIARSPETLFVVAAGNEAANNDSVPSYPCNYAVVNLVCVAATTSADSLASFSNYGGASVDLGAPGSRILSSMPTFATPLAETFEMDLSGRWVTGGTDPQWGRASDQYGYFVSDSPSGGYAPGTDSWIATATTVSISSSSRCALQFDLRLDVDATDRFRAEASADGSSWTRVGSWTGSTSGRYVGVATELSPLGEVTATHLRFRLISDAGAATGQGAEVDDVTIKCAESTGDTSRFAYLSGTSMAAPHVSGAAALFIASVPTAGPVEVAGALIRSGDDIAALSGKTTSGKRLNVGAALASLLPRVVLESPTPSSEVSQGASQPTAQASTAPGTPASTPTADDRESPSAEQTQPSTASPSAPPDDTPGPSTPPADPPPDDEAPPSENPGGGEDPPREPPPSDPPGSNPPPSDPPPDDQPRDEEPTGESTTHARRVTLQLRHHLVARGRIVVSGGPPGCLRQKSVKIVRNGRLIAESPVDDGRFFVRLPDLAGRYAAKIRSHPVGGSAPEKCGAARSAVVAHFH